MASPRMAGPEAVPLDRVSLDALAALFELERGAWRDVLGWDSPASVETFTRAIEWGVVRGAALRGSEGPLAYLLLQPGQAETRLCGVHLPLEAAPAAPALVRLALAEVPLTSRIEGQLLAFEGQAELDHAFRGLGLSVEPRDFLEMGPIAPAPARHAPPAVLGRAFRVRPLRAEDLGACADILVAAHAGGVESRINQAFRTPIAALAYLREIVDAGGCGRIRFDASSAACWRGRVAGFCIATTTAAGVGHVPQIALDPAAQGQGFGAILLGRALEVLAAEGCSRVTLSVSRANGRASAWYRRLGFRPMLSFASYHRDASG